MLEIGVSRDGSRWKSERGYGRISGRRRPRLLRSFLGHRDRQARISRASERSAGRVRVARRPRGPRPQAREQRPVNLSLTQGSEWGNVNRGLGRRPSPRLRSLRAFGSRGFFLDRSANRWKRFTTGTCDGRSSSSGSPFSRPRLEYAAFGAHTHLFSSSVGDLVAAAVVGGRDPSRGTSARVRPARRVCRSST